VNYQWHFGGGECGVECAKHETKSICGVYESPNKD